MDYLVDAALTDLIIPDSLQPPEVARTLSTTNAVCISPMTCPFSPLLALPSSAMSANAIFSSSVVDGVPLSGLLRFSHTSNSAAPRVLIVVIVQSHVLVERAFVPSWHNLLQRRNFDSSVRWRTILVPPSEPVQHDRSEIQPVETATCLPGSSV